jgi:Transposase DDE domain
MPFKRHSKGRRHIPRQRHRVTNWREYDASLRNRGSLMIWFAPAAIAGWRAQPRTTPGGQRHYSDLAIETALTLNGGAIAGQRGGAKPSQLGEIADMQRGPIGPLCMSAAKKFVGYVDEISLTSGSVVCSATD